MEENRTRRKWKLLEKQALRATNSQYVTSRLNHSKTKWRIHFRLERWHRKTFCIPTPIASQIYCPHPHLSVCILLELCPPPIPIHVFWLCNIIIIFRHLVFWTLRKRNIFVECRYRYRKTSLTSHGIAASYLPLSPLPCNPLLYRPWTMRSMSIVACPASFSATQVNLPASSTLNKHTYESRAYSIPRTISLTSSPEGQFPHCTVAVVSVAYLLLNIHEQRKTHHNVYANCDTYETFKFQPILFFITSQFILRISQLITAILINILNGIFS